MLTDNEIISVHLVHIPSILLPGLAFVSVAISLAQTTLLCRDSPSALRMRRKVRSFYNFREISTLLAIGPCSFEGNTVAFHKWPVFTQDEWQTLRSTCPWESTVDEDPFGDRFPCRIETARLSLAGSSAGPSLSSIPQPCLRTFRSQWGRTRGQLCEPLLQQVPIMIKTGCLFGENQYQLRNKTIPMAFICTFERISS